MSTETKTKKQNIINGLNYFIPFECGDDPAAWRQKDTVERIQKYLEKVLPDDEDATENLKPNDLKTEVECDHYGVDSDGTYYYGTSNPPQESDWNFAYCCKCGVKL
jgi:hypothetical protein